MKLRLGILVGLFMAFLSLYPQFYFQIQRGENYNGATFYYDFDECNYAAYIQALIDGRPRKNSIYQGGDEPQEKETFYSIQFVAAYIVAIPARFIGLSAESSFLCISVIFAILSSLTIFWLLAKITENHYFSATGTLFILIFGANIAGSSVLKEIFGLGTSAFYLAFLRRYTPAVAFPFIFLLIGSIWMALNSTIRKEKFLYTILVLVCFAFLTYSYFFYWTAILAWLCCFALLNSLFLTEKRNWYFWMVIFGGIIFLLVPYFFLMSNRNSTTDTIQSLEQIRKIVFFRPTLFFGIIIFSFTIIFLKLDLIKLKNQTTIFIISLTLLPLLVLNQQIITGYSLQPMHYERYILNYLLLFASVLLFYEIFKEKINQTKLFIWLFPVSIFCIWGVIETNHTINHNRRLIYNIRRDESILVNRHLAQIGKTNIDEAKSQITLNFDLIQGDNQPTLAPQGVLWAEHLLSTGNLSMKESRQRFFLYLYFKNINANRLRERLENCPNDVCLALIGWRVNRLLSIIHKKIEDTEIDSIIEEYENFINNLTQKEALRPTLSFVIIPNNLRVNLTNLDKWYERDSGEQFGNFKLYKVRPLEQ